MRHRHELTDAQWQEIKLWLLKYDTRKNPE